MKAPLILAIIVILHFNCFSQGSESKTHYIGEKSGGGVVFYIDGSGYHGLISAEQDQSDGAIWCGGTNTFKKIDAINMSDGFQNTNEIVKQFGNKNAAGICSELVLNGFDDWYLPSLQELSMMYSQSFVIGGFSMNDYWSSTVAAKDQGTAWGVAFAKKGKQIRQSNGKKFCVRAIRKF